MQLTDHEDFVTILRTLEVEHARANDHLHITVVSNITLKPIFDSFLRYFLLQNKMSAEMEFLQMDELLFTLHAVGPSPISHTTDFVMVLPHIDALSSKLSRTAYQYSAAELREEAHAVQTMLHQLLYGIRQNTDAVLLSCSLETPYLPDLIHLHQPKCNPLSLILDINHYILEKTSELHNAFPVDMNQLLLRYGAQQMYDPRQWHWTRSPYSKDGCRHLSRHIAGLISVFRGRSRKCLVLDCDGVLWGGIVGEDGIGGIRIGPNHPGSAYYEFQQELLHVHSRGILIALCSKNNESDVLEVLRNHPDMLLNEQHIAAYKINWEDKADNIRQLAIELNISLDSLVFMDDSEFETERVRAALPDVKTIHMPSNQPYRYRDILLDLHDFAVLTHTSEDRSRTRMYREDQNRRQYQESSMNGSVADYLASLQMGVKILMANELSIPRVAQLTQKTNQFNLTSRRCTEDDIRTMSMDDCYEVLAMEAEDRFGELGIIGAAIVHYNGSEAEIEQFLLSCRALGRSLEELLLAEIIRRACIRRTTSLSAMYIPTAKNQQTRSFYADRGFTLVDSNERQYVFNCRPDHYVGNLRLPSVKYLQIERGSQEVGNREPE